MYLRIPALIEKSPDRFYYLRARKKILKIHNLSFVIPRLDRGIFLMRFQFEDPPLSRRMTSLHLDQTTYGNSPMNLARLIACASLRWCHAHTPERLRGTIFPNEDKYRRKVFVSL